MYPNPSKIHITRSSKLLFRDRYSNLGSACQQIYTTQTKLNLEREIRQGNLALIRGLSPYRLTHRLFLYRVTTFTRAIALSFTRSALATYVSPAAIPGSGRYDTPVVLLAYVRYPRLHLSLTSELVRHGYLRRNAAQKHIFHKIYPTTPHYTTPTPRISKIRDFPVLPLKFERDFCIRTP